MPALGVGFPDVIPELPGRLAEVDAKAHPRMGRQVGPLGVQKSVRWNVLKKPLVCGVFGIIDAFSEMRNVRCSVLLAVCNEGIDPKKGIATRSPKKKRLGPRASSSGHSVSAAGPP
jgi:hypothetical protein